MTAEQLLAIIATFCALTAICNLITGFKLIQLCRAFNSAICKVYARKPTDVLRK